jgi:hypothetical protein
VSISDLYAATTYLLEIMGKKRVAFVAENVLPLEEKVLPHERKLLPHEKKLLPHEKKLLP